MAWVGTTHPVPVYQSRHNLLTGTGVNKPWSTQPSQNNNQCMKIWKHDGVSASASHGGRRRCCPEAGCSDTGAGCGVVTSGWCTDGGCAGLLINTKYTRGRTWSLSTVTTLASALAHCTGTLVHWWYKWYTVHALHLGHIVQRKQVQFCVVWWRNLDI